MYREMKTVPGNSNIPLKLGGGVWGPGREGEAGYENSPHAITIYHHENFFSKL
jgi:hypothetical protein